jgi:uncharacterized membrane protein
MSMMIEEPGEKLSIILILQLASLIVVAFGFWLAISAYPSLPHTYPVHFTLSGVPDGWDTKSWTSILRLPLIQLVLFMLMAGMTLWSLFSIKALAYINVPGLDRSKLFMLPDEEQKKVRWLAAVFSSLIGLLILLFFLYLNYAMIKSEIKGVSPSMSMILFVVVVLLIFVFAASQWLTAEVKKLQHQ